MILNPENLFLIILALVWIVGAVIQDLHRREVDYIWNFSLVAFAIFYRLAVSVFTGNYVFVLNGIFGFLLLFILGTFFYYSRIFAGGDAYLLGALGAILPLSYDWIINLKLMGLFILLFLITGAIYVFIWALMISFMNWNAFSKEFKKQWKSYSNLFLMFFVLVLLWIFSAILVNRIEITLIGIVVLLFPVLFIFGKAVEESCMTKLISPSELTVGDWLYEDIHVAGKKIKSTWEGVSEDDLKLIQKKCKKNILVKYGIPFTPAFLFGFLLLLLLAWRGFF